MNDTQLRRLLSQLDEAERLFGRASISPRAAWRPRIRLPLTIGAAAAACLLALWNPALQTAPRAMSIAGAVGLTEELPVTVDGDAPQRALRPCADVDAFAVLLLRVWSDETRGVTWHVHRQPDGSSLMRLRAGESFDIAMEPALAQVADPTVVLAVARYATDLPDSADETEQLVTCLNESGAAAPETFSSSVASAGCLSREVTLVSHALP